MSVSPRQRLLIGVVLVLGLFAVVGVWALTRPDPEPPLAAPGPPIFPNFSAPVTVLPDPASASAPAGPTPGQSSSRQARPTPPRPAPAPPPARRSPPPARAFTARYVITNSSSTRFQAGILLTNDSQTARNWQVRVSHDPTAGVRLQAGFGARISTSGDTLVFSGGPLDAGSSVTFGFQATKSATGVVRPTACLVDGRDCIVTVQ
jgi:hypothetical protein